MSKRKPKRRCLKCGRKVQAGVILCEACLDAINLARSFIDVGPRFEKERWASLRTLFGIFAFVGVVFLMSYLARFSYLYAAFTDSPLMVLSFFHPAFVNFIFYFFLGVILGKRICRRQTRLWANERFYSRDLSGFQRLKYIGFFPEIFKICLLFLLVFFIGTFIIFSVDAFLKEVFQNQSLQPFPRLSRRVGNFAISGFGPGFFVALYYYTRWINKLAK